MNLQVLLAALVRVGELLGQRRHLAGVKLEGAHQQRDVLGDCLPQVGRLDFFRNLHKQLAVKITPATSMNRFVYATASSVATTRVGGGCMCSYRPL